MRKEKLLFRKRCEYYGKVYEDGKVYEIEDNPKGFIEKWLRRGAVIFVEVEKEEIKEEKKPEPKKEPIVEEKVEEPKKKKQTKKAKSKLIAE